MADIKEHFDSKKKTHFDLTLSAPKTLEEVLKACGSWEDERSAREIVAELYRLRRSRSSEVQL